VLICTVPLQIEVTMRAPSTCLRVLYLTSIPAVPLRTIIPQFILLETLTVLAIDSHSVRFKSWDAAHTANVFLPPFTIRPETFDIKRDYFPSLRRVRAPISLLRALLSGHAGIHTVHVVRSEDGFLPPISFDIPPNIRNMVVERSRTRDERGVIEYCVDRFVGDQLVLAGGGWNDDVST
jgi:hypothetical protein